MSTDLDSTGLDEDFLPPRPASAAPAAPAAPATDGFPFAEGADDEEVNIDFLNEITPEMLAKQTYRNIPVGQHQAMVLRVEWAGRQADRAAADPIQVYVPRGGSIHGEVYYSRCVNVVFAIPGDERCTIRDMFRLTPSAATEVYAYEHGFGDESKAVAWLEKMRRQESREPSATAPASANLDDGGFWAKKLRYFLSRLFQPACDANGKLRPEVARTKNWIYYPGTDIHRLIQFRVIPGQQRKPYTDAAGRTITPNVYDQIQMFSYQYVVPPIEAGVPPPPPDVPAPVSAPISPATNRGRGRRSPQV